MDKKLLALAREKTAIYALRTGKLGPVIEMLRAGDTTPLVQGYLADLLSGDPKQDYQIDIRPRDGLQYKKTLGSREIENTRAITIANYISERIEEGIPRQRAFGFAADAFGIKDKTAERCYYKWRHSLRDSDV